MILKCFNHSLRQTFGLCPSRLVYFEVPPAQVDSRMSEVENDVTRSIHRRAQITRDHLDENGFKDAYADAGLNVADPSDDTQLVKAVVALQMQLFPDKKDEQDGMYGERTFRKYREQLEHDNATDKLRVLRDKVEQGRKAMLKLDGDMVEHEVKADDPLVTKFQITKEVIEGAQNECKRPASVEELTGRENFNKVVQYAAKATDVPPALIVATTWAETNGTFSQKDFGSYQELGMGHFLQKYWHDYTNKKEFVDAMRNVVPASMSEDAIKNIGRARSMVADFVAIGIKLKEAVSRLGIDFDYNTDVSQMPDDDLMKIRFHYFAPGYAYALWQTNTHGDNYLVAAQHSYDGVKNHLQTRFADKAKQAYAKLKPID